MRFSVVLCLCLLGPMLQAQEPAPGIEDELQALVQAATRLVEHLERREADSPTADELPKIQVAVQLLDIRVRQQVASQEALDSIESREQRLEGWIASNQVKVDNLEQQIAEAIDETRKAELRHKLQEQRVYLDNRLKELEFSQQRRAVLQGRLIEGERLVDEIEDLVQAWVRDVQEAQ